MVRRDRATVRRAEGRSFAHSGTTGQRRSLVTSAWTDQAAAAPTAYQSRSGALKVEPSTSRAAVL